MLFSKSFCSKANITGGSVPLRCQSAINQPSIRCENSEHCVDNICQQILSALQNCNDISQAVARMTSLNGIIHHTQWLIIQDGIMLDLCGLLFGVNDDDCFYHLLLFVHTRLNKKNKSFV